MVKKKLITEQFAEHRVKINSNSFLPVNDDPDNPLQWLANKETRQNEVNRRSSELMEFYKNNVKNLAARLAEAEMWIEIQNISGAMQSKVYEISSKEINSLVQQRILAGRKRNKTKIDQKDKYLEVLRTEVQMFFEKNNVEITRSQFFEIAKKTTHRSPEAIEKYWLTIKMERNIPT